LLRSIPVHPRLQEAVTTAMHELPTLVRAALTRHDESKSRPQERSAIDFVTLSFGIWCLALSLTGEPDLTELGRSITAFAGQRELEGGDVLPGSVALVPRTAGRRAHRAGGCAPQAQ
jgi:hypothetical protein